MAWFFIFSDKVKASGSDINHLVLDDCHFATIRGHFVSQIMDYFDEHKRSERLLGLSAPLVPQPGGADPGRLEAEVEQLESAPVATTETDCDIVSALRYSSKPREVVLECGEFIKTELVFYLEDILKTATEFLDDHRYDPSEIYEEEYVDDIKDIPSPKQEPYNIIENFLTILHTMGKL